MGYIRHDAIIVTTWNKDRLQLAHQFAKDVELPVSEIVEGWTNGYCSFLIAPDGSKEGWDDSNKGDEARIKLIEWIRANPSLYFDWVHVSYGGDNKDDCEIMDHAKNDVG